MLKRSQHTDRPRFITRSLRLGDIPALIELEKMQWNAEQAATADDFRHRIQAYPKLSTGAFRVDTGELVASIFFCRPTCASDWATSTLRGGNGTSDSLFGINLTSIDGAGALQLTAFHYLYAVKRGKRFAYLGSPMPGLARHLGRTPQADVEAYPRSTRSGLPVDPQLRYYHGRAFAKWSLWWTTTSRMRRLATMAPSFGPQCHIVGCVRCCTSCRSPCSGRWPPACLGFRFRGSRERTIRRPPQLSDQRS